MAEERIERKTAKVDRLSELPDSVIHYILSFVPTVDVVRMSILSKRWRRMWHSMPVLCFNDSAYYGRPVSRKLCKFVGKCFALRKNDLLGKADKVITKVKLSTRYRWSKIFYWVGLVAKSKLKELDLEIGEIHSRSLPPEIFCSRSLTHIRLKNVALGDLHSSSLPSLISLSLENVRLDDQVLHNLLLGCSSLEKLLVNYCRNLSNPKVSSSSLKFLEIDSPGSDIHDIHEMFRVEAVNLESLVWHGSCTCSIPTLSSCAKLRNLTLYGSKLGDQCLEDLILRFSLLESLTLDQCHALRHIKICHQHLKHITLRVFEKRICDQSDVTIDSPNLVCFRFEGSPSLKISMNVKNLMEAYVMLSPRSLWYWYDRCNDYDMRWYTNLLDFLAHLDCSKNVSLCVYLEEALIFPGELRRAHNGPLPNVKHLKVTTGRPLLRNTDLEDSLFWAVPSLETLRVNSRTS